jgi:hypothetical protein
MPRFALILEFLILFVAPPSDYRLSPLRFPLLPLLWIATAYAYWQLPRDRQFDRTLLWNASAVRHCFPGFLGSLRQPHS